MKNQEKLMGMIGKEYSIIELSNKLQALGYEDICQSEFDWEELLLSGCVIVALAQDDYSEHIRIEFNVTIWNGDDESADVSNIKILNIEEY